MFFIKKLALGFVAIALIFVGGSGTQSSSLILQGGGFIGIIVGLVVMYLFGKMVWRAMGCLPLLLIIGVIVGFVMYAIGAFSGGVENVGYNLQNFLGSHSSSSSFSLQGENASLEFMEPEMMHPAPIQAQAPLLSENFNDMAAVATTPPAQACPPHCVQPPQQAAPQQRQAQPQQEGGLVGVISSVLTGNKGASSGSSGGFNPNNYPAVYGIARVINGSTLEMRGRYIKIYGIDAPDSNQTCSDSKGRSYACGQESARWLKGWISGYELECRVIQQDGRGNMVATCALGQYDIGAALVNAGWAVANIKTTNIYVPYEQQAQAAGRGLWQGSFYKPWDWREIQSKKPKIKVIAPKGPKKGLFESIQGG